MEEFSNSPDQYSADTGVDDQFVSTDECQTEFLQVVKKRPQVVQEVYEEDEEFIPVTKKRTVTTPPPETPPETPATASAYAPKPGEKLLDRDEDGDVALHIKRRVASPMAVGVSQTMQNIDRKPGRHLESDKLMKPKNYFFGCFSFLLISGGLIFGTIIFASKNWKEIRSSLHKFDNWMVDHNLAKRIDKTPEHERIQDEIQAELLADTNLSDQKPRVRNAKDAVRHVRNYVQACDLVSP